MSLLWRADELTDGKWKIVQCSGRPETAKNTVKSVSSVSNLISRNNLCGGAISISDGIPVYFVFNYVCIIMFMLFLLALSCHYTIVRIVCIFAQSSPHRVIFLLLPARLIVKRALIRCDIACTIIKIIIDCFRYTFLRIGWDLPLELRERDDNLNHPN